MIMGIDEPQMRFITGRSIRLLLVDDHAMTRMAIRGVLASQTDIEIVGEADDGVGAIRLAARLEPDVIVMDIYLPGMTGIDAARHIKTRFPQMAIIGLSVFANEHRDTMKAVGASAVVPKEKIVEQLHAAIRLAVQETGRESDLRGATVAGSTEEPPPSVPRNP